MKYRVKVDIIGEGNPSYESGVLNSKDVPVDKSIRPAEHALTGKHEYFTLTNGRAKHIISGSLMGEAVVSIIPVWF